MNTACKNIAIAVPLSFLIAGCSTNETKSLHPVEIKKPDVQAHDVELGVTRINAALVPGVGIRSTKVMPTLYVKDEGLGIPGAEKSANQDLLSMKTTVEQQEQQNYQDGSDDQGPQTMKADVDHTETEPASLQASTDTNDRAPEKMDAPVEAPKADDNATGSIGTVNTAIRECQIAMPCFKNEVMFELDSYAVTDQSFLSVVDGLKGENVEVIGYADRVGDYEYNVQLALKRAEGVQTVLENAGVNVASIKTPLVSSLKGENFRKVIIVGL